MSAPRDPFHDGERAAQGRVGVQARMAQVGALVIRDEMPDPHREFFGELPWLVVATTDDRGRPWASAIAGPPGFVDAPTADRLTIDASRDPNDPVVGATLRAGAQLGILGIQPHTRRRNRANGQVVAVDVDAIAIHIRESFGNCPKFIQARAPSYHAMRIVPPTAQRGLHLDAAMRASIAAADTFYLASAHAEAGVDVSHRGGKPGFVRVDGDVLTVPDFTGNFLFNTIGNLMVDPRAGLVFIDFERGDLLHLTADVEIVWEGPEVDAFAGAQRLLRFTVREVVHRPGALPLRWTDATPSPFVAATGDWRAAQ